jgi:hypothetical protein
MLRLNFALLDGSISSGGYFAGLTNHSYFSVQRVPKSMKLLCQSNSPKCL